MLWEQLELVGIIALLGSILWEIRKPKPVPPPVYIPPPVRPEPQAAVRQSIPKIHGLCQVVTKGPTGEWDQVGAMVHMDSPAGLNAINTPGVALRARSGEVHEGAQ